MALGSGLLKSCGVKVIAAEERIWEAGVWGASPPPQVVKPTFVCLMHNEAKQTETSEFGAKKDFLVGKASIWKMGGRPRFVSHPPCWLPVREVFKGSKGRESWWFQLPDKTSLVDFLGCCNWVAVFDLYVPAEQTSKRGLVNSYFLLVGSKSDRWLWHLIIRAFVMVLELQFLIDSPGVINFKSICGQLVEITGHYVDSLGS